MLGSHSKKAPGGKEVALATHLSEALPMYGLRTREHTDLPH